MLGVSPQQDNSHECYDSGLGIAFSLMVNTTDYDASSPGSVPAGCRVLQKADIGVTNQINEICALVEPNNIVLS